MAATTSHHPAPMRKLPTLPSSSSSAYTTQYPSASPSSSRPSLPRSVSSPSDLRNRPPSLALHPPQRGDAEPRSLLPPSLGPPPSSPLPELPPYPSPIAPATLSALVRGPATERRSSRRVAEPTTDTLSSPVSPRSSLASVEMFRDASGASSITPSVSGHSIASFSRAKSRPISVQSFASHISAASDALGQSIADLDREADALGILPPTTSRLHGSKNSKRSNSTASRRSITSRRITPSPSLESLPSSSSNPNTSLSIQTSASLRKSSLRLLKPLPGLPSPQEEAEPEDPFQHSATVPTASRSSSPDIQDIIESTPRPSRSRPGSLRSTRSSRSLSSKTSQGQLKSSRSSLTKAIPPIETMPSVVHVPGSSQIRSPTRRDRRSVFSDTLYASDDGRRLSKQSQMDMREVELGWVTPDSTSDCESESSIDLHTPLPQLLVREGLLSPSSTVVRSMNEASDPNARPTDVRKRRHRDGKLLREGVGLTTGLGWSDSEDEDAPGPLRRRLSSALLRRVNSVAGPLSGSRPPSIMAPSILRMQSSMSMLRTESKEWSNRTDSSREEGPTSPKESRYRDFPITPNSSANSLDGKASEEQPTIPIGLGPPPRRRRPSDGISISKSNRSLKVDDEDEFAAAEAAYRASKEITKSLASNRSSRVTSSAGSRESMMSNSSSTTEFGAFRSHRAFSGPPLPPPSAYNFPAGDQGRSQPLVKSASRNSVTAPVAPEVNSLDPVPRIAKLSNASSSSFSSTTHSVALSRSSTTSAPSSVTTAASNVARDIANMSTSDAKAFASYSAISGVPTKKLVTPRSSLPSLSRTPTTSTVRSIASQRSLSTSSENRGSQAPPMIAMSLAFPSPPPNVTPSKLRAHSITRHSSITSQVQ